MNLGDTLTRQCRSAITARAAVIFSLMTLLAPLSAMPAQEPDSVRPGPHHRGPHKFGHHLLGPRSMLDLENPSVMIERLRKDLALTEEQVREIRGIAERFRVENADALERARKLREELRAARNLEGGRPDREDLDAILEKHGRPFKELHPELFRLREDVLERLGDDQRKRLERMRRHWRERAHDGFEDHVRGSPPRHSPEVEVPPGS